jgi:hypothetical protein
VKGTVYWTEKGYKCQVSLESRTEHKALVEFINNYWFILKRGKDRIYQTNIRGRFPTGQYGTGSWPSNHPNNPQKTFVTAPSFGDILIGNINLIIMEGPTRPSTAQSMKERNNKEPYQWKQ